MPEHHHHTKHKVKHHKSNKFDFLLSRRSIMAGSALLILIIAFSIAELLGVIDLFKIGAETLGEKTITNSALIKYCTEGDSASVCDPANNKFSSEIASNTVTTTVAAEPSVPTDPPGDGGNTTKNICVSGIKLSNRAVNQYTHNKVNVSISSTDGSLASPIQLTGAMTSDGTLTVTTDAAIDNTKTYNLLVKPAGYFQRKIAAASAITSNCIALTGDSQVYKLGDLSGTDGKSTLADVVAAIRAYNNVFDDTTREAFSNKRPPLSDIVSIIREYNAKTQDEN